MPNSVLVGNLAIETTESSLETIFSKIGPVQKITFAVDHKGMHRGFAYVIFENRIQAQKAVEKMNGVECNNRKLTVDFKSPSKPQKNNLLSNCLKMFNF